MSSTGPCAALALDEIYKNRELYIAQNRDQILTEIAVGQGEHLGVLASFSLCDSDAYAKFAIRLQSEIDGMLRLNEGQYGPYIDRKVSSDKELQGKCYVYGQSLGSI